MSRHRDLALAPTPSAAVHARAPASSSRARDGTAGDRQLLTVDASDGELLGSIGIGVNERMKNGLIGYWVAAPPVDAACEPALRPSPRGARRCRPGAWSCSDPENVASQRVAEKVGFRREVPAPTSAPHRGAVMSSLLPGKPRNASALERGVGDEESRKTLLRERADGVERLGRRAGLEGDEVARRVEPQQRVGEPPLLPSRRAPRRSGRRRAPASATGADARTRPRRGRARRGARSNQPPTREISTTTTATITAAVCTRTSRRRTWASSCAKTPSSSAGRSAPSRPVETATAELCGPRPAASARG